MNTATLTASTMAPKRYVAWNKKTGLFLGNSGCGFTETRKEFSPLLSETELLLVRYQWKNVEWGRI